MTHCMDMHVRFMQKQNMVQNTKHGIYNRITKCTTNILYSIERFLY